MRRTVLVLILALVALPIAAQEADVAGGPSVQESGVFGIDPDLTGKRGAAVDACLKTIKQAVGAIVVCQLDADIDIDVDKEKKPEHRDGLHRWRHLVVAGLPAEATMDQVQAFFEAVMREEVAP